jgi:hypothetical protein
LSNKKKKRGRRRRFTWCGWFSHEDGMREEENKREKEEE